MFLLDGMYMHLWWGGETGQQQAVETMQSVNLQSQVNFHILCITTYNEKVLRGDANTARWL